MESISKATAEDFCKERPQIRPVWKICEEFEDKQLHWHSLQRLPLEEMTYNLLL